MNTSIWLFAALATGVALATAAAVASRARRRAAPPAVESPAVETPVDRAPPDRSATDPPDKGVPEWAGFMPARRYRRFRDRVVDHFARQTAGTGGAVTVTDGTVVVHDGVGGVRAQYGLQNLAQVYHRLDDQADGPAGADLIDRHFATVSDLSKSNEREVDRLAADWSAARPRLRVRLGPGNYAPQLREKMIWRTDLPGTITYLALDLPDSFTNVRPDMPAAWGQPPDAVWDAAMQNVRAEVHPDAGPIALTDGVAAVGLIGEDFATSTHALLLGDRPDCLGRWGSLVVVPNRHTVVCVPMDAGSVVTAVGPLAGLASGLFAEGPGSISPQLYWRRPTDGSFIDLPYTIEADRLTFTPPPAFVEALEGLAAEETPE